MEQVIHKSHKIGVNNGTLLLDRKVRLIKEPFTGKVLNAEYVPYDPNDKYVKELEALIAEIIIEKDSRDVILKYFASTIDFKLKYSILLLLYGTGANGKSFIMNLHKELLGENLICRISFDFLTNNRRKFNPCLQEMKHSHLTYFSETETNSVIYMTKVREITGLETISTRGLFESQTKFIPHGHSIAAVNNEPRIIGYNDKDHERILFYKCKTTFKNNPDYRNPLEKLNRRDYIDKINLDKDGHYKRAWLSILIKHYIELQTKYKGCVMDVPNYTIKKETLAYINSQEDTIDRFIKTSLRYRNDLRVTISLSKVAESYKIWHFSNISKKDYINILDIEKALYNSSLRDYIFTDLSSQSRWLIYHHLMSEGT